MEKKIFIRKCECCGVEFETTNEYKRFCSRKCKEKEKNRRRSKGISNQRIYTKVCLCCGKIYKTNIINQLYCCLDCRLQEKKPKYDFNLTMYNVQKIKSNIRAIILEHKKEERLKQKQEKLLKKQEEMKAICPICGKEFIRKTKRQIYCNKKCYGVSCRKNKNIIERKLRQIFRKSLDNCLNGRSKKRIRRITISKLNFEYILGCNFQEYKTYLEKMFSENMSWNNYGDPKFGWQIDHIVPRSSFNFINDNGGIDMDEVCRCFNYKNTQPLFSIDNASKGQKDYQEWLKEKGRRN